MSKKNTKHLKDVKKPYQRFTYTEETLRKAVEKVRSGKLTLNLCSRLYKIPRSTLHNKILNKTPFERKMGPTPVLTAEEENKIKCWIINQSKLGFPMNPENVKDDVQKILKETKRENPFKNDRPGRKWFSLFLQRHPEILKENTEKLLASEESIKNWFNNLQKYLEIENAIDILSDGSRILTCNELGLSLGSNNLITYFSEESSPCVMLTFAGDGTDLPATINYPCNTLSKSIINSIPDDWAYGKLEKIGDCFYDYVVNVLFVWLNAKNVKFPVILFRDGQRNFVSRELSKFCLENKIILYSIPQHTSIINPFNLIFKRLKQTWNKLVHKKNIDTENFAEFFYKAFKSAVNCELIRNSYFVSGLFPFDCNAIDYSKCVQPTQNIIFNEPNEISKFDLQTAKKVIEDIIGEKKVKQFQTNNINSEDLSLYTVWRKCSYGPEEEYVLIVN